MNSQKLNRSSSQIHKISNSNGNGTQAAVTGAQSGIPVIKKKVINNILRAF